MLCREIVQKGGKVCKYFVQDCSFVFIDGLENQLFLHNDLSWCLTVSWMCFYKSNCYDVFSISSSTTNTDVNTARGWLLRLFIQSRIAFNFCYCYILLVFYIFFFDKMNIFCRKFLKLFHIFVGILKVFCS